MFNIKKQLLKLYSSSILGSLSLTGAWVAILSSRGYSPVEIGFAETVFHAVSLTFEIPSGVLADVFGRKKMLIASAVLRMIASVIMIFSHDLFTVCLSIAFQALCFNAASGSDEALAYDSLKTVKKESDFERYNSNCLIIYRICGGISTLCAGFALAIGYKAAYSTDLIMCVMQILVLSSLCEVQIKKSERGKVWTRLIGSFSESLAFLKRSAKAIRIMLCNSFVGAVDTLLLFFLQAKLPERGIPEWQLGFALLFMELGGVVGSKLILRIKGLRYKWVFALSAALVFAGTAAEGSLSYYVMILGGFISAAGDDALQVRTNALLQDMFPSEQRASLTSVDSFTFSVIMIILSPIAGFIFSIY